MPVFRVAARYGEYKFWSNGYNEDYIYDEYTDTWSLETNTPEEAKQTVKNMIESSNKRQVLSITVKEVGQ